jgi:2-hydroxyisobutanoyl-CoA mutase small subunit
MAKAGLDGHDRGVKVVARALRDGGMEVIYTGLHRTPEQVVTAALQEDVDVVGVSILSGAHMTIIPRIVAGLCDAGALDTVVVVGGVMPDEDVTKLMESGVSAVFGQDTAPNDIVEDLRRLVATRRS